MWDRLRDFKDSKFADFRYEVKRACNGIVEWLRNGSKSVAGTIKNKVTGFLHGDIKLQLKSSGDVVGQWMDKQVLNVKGRTVRTRQIVLGVLLLGGVAATVVILQKGKTNPTKKPKQFMKGLATWSYNGIEGLRLTAELVLPETIPKDGVLIRVEAASVDLVDIRILYGYGRRWISRSALTIPGRDCSGVVVKVGSDVTDLSPGDKVWAFSTPREQGLLSEFTCLPVDRVSLMPDSVSFAEAASIPYSAILTWQALCIHAGIGPTNTDGKRFLVHVGNSPCGCLAIQLVKAWGGHVTATVPTTGLPLARLLGADDVIVFSVTDFQDELKTREKFDVVLNTVMGSALHDLCLELCAPGGMVVSTANPFPGLQDCTALEGLIPVILHQVKCMWKALLQILWTTTEDRQWKLFTFDKEILEHIQELIETGQLEPVVEEVFNIKNAIEAFQRVASGDTVGKTVIKFK